MKKEQARELLAGIEMGGAVEIRGGVRIECPAGGGLLVWEVNGRRDELTAARAIKRLEGYKADVIEGAVYTAAGEEPARQIEEETVQQQVEGVEIEGDGKVKDQQETAEPEAPKKAAERKTYTVWGDTFQDGDETFRVTITGSFKEAKAELEKVAAEGPETTRFTLRDGGIESPGKARKTIVGRVMGTKERQEMLAAARAAFGSASPEGVGADAGGGETVSATFEPDGTPVKVEVSPAREPKAAPKYAAEDLPPGVRVSKAGYVKIATNKPTMAKWKAVEEQRFLGGREASARSAELLGRVPTTIEVRSPEELEHLLESAEHAAVLSESVGTPAAKANARAMRLIAEKLAATRFVLEGSAAPEKKTGAPVHAQTDHEPAGKKKRPSATRVTELIS